LGLTYATSEQSFFLPSTLFKMLFALFLRQGCACKFLWGVETEDEKRAEIERSLSDKAELQIEVTLYKKNSESESFRGNA